MKIEINLDSMTMDQAALFLNLIFQKFQIKISEVDDANELTLSSCNSRQDYSGGNYILVRRK
jgi:hypothetical protein